MGRTLPVVQSSGTAIAAPPASRLEIPAGAVMEPLRCSLCGAIVAAAVIPPAPPLPFELRTLFRPIARYIVRRSPGLQGAVDCLLEGNFGGMVQELRKSEQLQTLVPVICSSCVTDPQTLLVRATNGD